MIWIGRGRKRETIDAFWTELSEAQRDGVEGVAMDMWMPYFESTMVHLPDAAKKIVFDKYHLTTYLTKAVDLTRRRNVRELGADGAELKGTKYTWLRNPKNMDSKERRTLTSLSKQFRTVGRAWAIKESFGHFWHYRRESIARRYFTSWYNWAIRSRISAIAEAARTFKRHFENIARISAYGSPTLPPRASTPKSSGSSIKHVAFAMKAALSAPSYSTAAVWTSIRPTRIPEAPFMALQDFWWVARRDLESR